MTFIGTPSVCYGPTGSPIGQLIGQRWTKKFQNCPKRGLTNRPVCNILITSVEDTKWGDSNMATERKSERLRFTVPTKDDTVLRWVAEQSNLSVSLRMLIRWAIQEYGYADVTCLSVKRGRGRPNNTAEEFHYEAPEPAYEPAPRPSAPAYPAQSAPVRPSVPMQTAPPARSAPPVASESGAEPVARPVQVTDAPERDIPDINDLLKL